MMEKEINFQNFKPKISVEPQKKSKDVENNEIVYDRQISLSCMSDLVTDAVPDDQSTSCTFQGLHQSADLSVPPCCLREMTVSDSPNFAMPRLALNNISHKTSEEDYQPASVHKPVEAMPSEVIEEEEPEDIEEPIVHGDFDAVIIHHDNDIKHAVALKERLSQIKLDDGTCAKIAVQSDLPTLGKGEISYFETWLKHAEMMYLFSSEDYCKDRYCVFKSEVALLESFFYEWGKKEFVVPLFLENKRQARYLTPTLRTIKGIEYIDMKWNDRMEDKFRMNLNMARKRRNCAVDGLKQLTLKE